MATILSRKSTLQTMNSYFSSEMYEQVVGWILDTSSLRFEIINLNNPFQKRKDFLIRKFENFRNEIKLPLMVEGNQIDPLGSEVRREFDHSLFKFPFFPELAKNQMWFLAVPLWVLMNNFKNI
jgi:hypothetical protein